MALPMSEQLNPVGQMPDGGVVVAAMDTPLNTTGTVTRGASASAAMPTRYCVPMGMACVEPRTGDQFTPSVDVCVEKKKFGVLRPVSRKLEIWTYAGDLTDGSGRDPVRSAMPS